MAAAHSMHAVLSSLLRRTPAALQEVRRYALLGQGCISWHLDALELWHELRSTRPLSGRPGLDGGDSVPRKWEEHAPVEHALATHPPTGQELAGMDMEALHGLAWQVVHDALLTITGPHVGGHPRTLDFTLLLRLSWAPPLDIRALALGATAGWACPGTPIAVDGHIRTLHPPTHRIAYRRWACAHPGCRDPNTLHHHPPWSTGVGQSFKRTSTHAPLRMVLPGRAEEVDRFCSACDVRLTEDLSAARSVPLQRIVLVDASCGLGGRHLEVWVEGPEVGAFRVGQRVRAIGYQVVRDLAGRGGGWVMERCLGMRPICDRPGPGLTPEDAWITHMPPYELSQALVDRFGAHLCPPSAYRKLKLALLLSLSSLSSGSAPLHVFVLADGACPEVTRLLHHAARLAGPHAVVHHLPGQSATRGLRGAQGADGPPEHPSPLTQAWGGVLLAFTHAHTPSRMHMRLHEVAHARPASHAVWVHHERPTRHRHRRGGGGAPTGDAPAGLPPTSSAYDLRINALAPAEPGEQDSRLAEHLLDASLPTSADTCAHRDADARVGRWLQHVRTLAPTPGAGLPLHPEAKATLLAYYTCLRQVAGKLVLGLDGMCMTMDALVRIAQAHARLCARARVVLDDALIAVDAVEESLCLSTGQSLLGYTSCPGDAGNLATRFSDNPLRPPSERVPDWEEGEEQEQVNGQEGQGTQQVHVFVAFYRHLRAVLERHGVSLEHT